ncbi:MAG: glycyl-radical enzyme activating protein [Firmicutes bacterium]|nr:glycyl-radical enzyme activating protein [Bacillota bacterium]
MSAIKGQIFNIQHFSTEDGPGVRTTVFLKGCPLRCLWCANPESQKAVRQLANRSALCIKCGCCIKNCPNEALSVKDGAISIDRGKCVSCGTCVNVCPSRAMFFYGEEKTVDQVFEEVMRDKGFYESSGGGVTCSGGECMMQADFVGELFRRCKERGIHTTLDTCGHFPSEGLEKVLPHTDLVLYDIKHMDSGKHREFTGVGNELILQNLKLILDASIKVFIRVPVIPSYNDSVESLMAIAGFIKELDPSLHVDLLPYHRFGLAKYKMLDMPYLPEDVSSPTEEQKESYKRIFINLGLDCVMH